MSTRCSDKDLECAIARTASLICGRWTLLILRDLAASPQRFCTLERSLEGISPNTLVERLRTLGGRADHYAPGLCGDSAAGRVHSH